MTDIVMLYCTAPDTHTAESISNALVEEKLAACVNILPVMTSVYAWEGKVEKAGEAVFIVKTAISIADAARDRIVELHPYDCPCVIALPSIAAASFGPFLNWVKTATNA
ncbi:MAG: divalent-cation tolerance protein CutA [Pseudomonadota bacterium]